MRHHEMRQLALKGARKILDTCLSLNSGDVLALFRDGSTRKVGTLLVQAAQELELNIRDRFVPVKEQVAFRGRLSHADHAALTEARGILTCVSSNPRATAYRRELLKVGPSFDNFFGHMPGATLEVLANAAIIDHVAAEKRCDDLALAFTLGRHAVLRTYELDMQGKPVQEHVLHVDLVGFGRSPITSTGIIPKGTWGNIPGGEVFIAPMESSAHGHFVMNGAFKNNVLAHGTSVRLKFEDGRLVGFDGDEKACTSFQRLLRNARERGGKNYDALAELGVGVNPGVSELKGIALFDEKAAGTAHIAIGDNESYGGKNPAGIHEDFVTKRPSLEIDGKPILSFGEDVFDSRQFRESIRDKLSVECGVATEDFLFINHEADIRRGSSGALRVRRYVAEGRICEYTIGDSETSPQLFSLCRLLPGKLREVLEKAQKELGMPPELGIRGLDILSRHCVVSRAEQV